MGIRSCCWSCSSVLALCESGQCCQDYGETCYFRTMWI